MKRTTDQSRNEQTGGPGLLSSRSMTAIATLVLIASVALPAQVQAHPKTSAWATGFHEFDNGDPLDADTRHCDSIHDESGDASRAVFCDQEGDGDENETVKRGFGYAPPKSATDTSSELSLHQDCLYTITNSPISASTSTDVVWEDLRGDTETVCEASVSVDNNLREDRDEHASHKFFSQSAGADTDINMTSEIREDGSLVDEDTAEFTLRYVAGYLGSPASTMKSPTYDDFMRWMSSPADEYRIADPEANNKILIDGTEVLTASDSDDKLVTADFTYEKTEWTEYKDCCIQNPRWDTSRMDSGSLVWTISHNADEAFGADISDGDSERETTIEEYSI